MNAMNEAGAKAQFDSAKCYSLIRGGLLSIFGALFLSLTAQISLPLPFTPIPLTMQTFALFALAPLLGKNRATGAALLYLLAAALGLPVLAGAVANPAWIFLPSAGYLFGFAACTYITGSLLEGGGKGSLSKTLLSMATGQIALYAMGSLYLALFVGLKNALSLGVLPFLFTDALKLLLAASLMRGAIGLRLPFKS